MAEFYDFDSHQLECEVSVFYTFANNIIQDTPSIPELAQLFVVKSLTVMFPLVWKLIQIAACIPVSTASPEQTFSALRRLKTYLRSTMGEQRLSGLALMNIEAEVAESLESKLDLIVGKSSSQRRSDFYWYWFSFIIYYYINLCRSVNDSFPIDIFELSRFAREGNFP